MVDQKDLDKIWDLYRDIDAKLANIKKNFKFNDQDRPSHILGKKLCQEAIGTFISTLGKRNAFRLFPQFIRAFKD